MRTASVIFASWCLFVLAGCDWLQNGEEALLPPVMLRNPADTTFQENGIDAVPESNGIQVQWITAGLYGIREYRLYRFSFDDDSGLKTARDSLIAVIPAVEVAGDTGYYMDDDVLLDIRYYYYARSVGGDGTSSDPSGSVDYKLISKISLTKLESPRTAIDRGNPIFKLGDLTADISVHTFFIKVYDVNTGRIIWVSGEIDPFNQSVLTYNYNGKALPGYETLAADRYYRWRVDATGRNEKSGSESDWVEFSVVNN